MSSHQLKGTERQHPVNSVAAGDPAPDQNIQVTLLLRRKQDPPFEGFIHARLSHDEFTKVHGADPADIETVKQFASENDLAVTGIHLGSRSVLINGPIGRLAALFCADVRLSCLDSKLLRTRQGSLHLPEALQSCVVGVFGFDERPAAATCRQFQKHSFNSTSYKPTAIAELYKFPANTGKGQTIGLVELGGGYRDSDLQTYWKQIGVNQVSVKAVAVDDEDNAPAGDPDSADGEVVLDIEVAGAVAPGATIAVYFAPNTDAGFLNAVNAAIHDDVRKPSVISISWGAAESVWTSQSMNAFNAAFHDAALLGISICVAAGDNGSSDGEKDGHTHVDFPASSPWILACGGTRLIGSNGQIQSETVWNDGTSGGATGGGVSSFFSQPPYQAASHIPKPTRTDNSTGRGVPDVAGVADPETGYEVFVDGQASVVGGTSAVAPLWAGLIALLNEELGRNLGWFHSVLYGTVTQHKMLHDITSGTNGKYKALVGWDCCTGLGTPNGTALLGLLKQTPAK